MDRSAFAGRACLGAALFLALALPASSQDRPIAGTYTIGGESLSDPPPGEAKNTHLRLYLTGAAARDLYKALKTKPMADECTGPNAQTKLDRGISCTMQAGGKEFECSLGIDLRTQKLAPFSSDC